MLYPVEITETLQRTVYVRAPSKDEAQFRVEDEWKAEKHVLTADDFVDVNFSAGEPTTCAM